MTQSLSPFVMTTTPRQSRRSCWTLFTGLLKLVPWEPRTTADCEPKSASSSASTATDCEEPPTPIQYNQDPKNISTRDVKKEGSQQEIPKANDDCRSRINTTLFRELRNIQTTDARTQNNAIGANQFPLYSEGSTSHLSMDPKAVAIRCLEIEDSTVKYWNKLVESYSGANTPYW